MVLGLELDRSVRAQGLLFITYVTLDMLFHLFEFHIPPYKSELVEGNGAVARFKCQFSP